jgi:hypothetical protein
MNPLRRETSGPDGRADRHCSHPIPLRNEIVREAGHRRAVATPGFLRDREIYPMRRELADFGTEVAGTDPFPTAPGLSA